MQLLNVFLFAALAFTAAGQSLTRRGGYAAPFNCKQDYHQPGPGAIKGAEKLAACMDACWNNNPAGATPPNRNGKNLCGKPLEAVLTVVWCRQGCIWQSLVGRTDCILDWAGATQY